MKENDLITRRDVEIALLEKGQRSRRYKLGDIWELNYDEIRDALSEYQQKIVRCEDCKYRSFYCTEATDGTTLYTCHHPCANDVPRPLDWFCADGKRRDNGD